MAHRDHKWWQCFSSNRIVTIMFCEVLIVVSLLVVAFYLRDTVSHSLSPMGVSLALSSLGIALGLTCSFLGEHWRRLRNEKRDDH